MWLSSRLVNSSPQIVRARKILPPDGFLNSETTVCTLCARYAISPTRPQENSSCTTVLWHINGTADVKP